jgi:hypothetical protein
VSKSLRAGAIPAATWASESILCGSHFAAPPGTLPGPDNSPAAGRPFSGRREVSSG